MNMKNLAWKFLLLVKETKNMKKIMMNTNWEWLLVTMVHMAIHIIGFSKALDHPSF
jgi:hypothetical protein